MPETDALRRLASEVRRALQDHGFGYRTFLSDYADPESGHPVLAILAVTPTSREDDVLDELIELLYAAGLPPSQWLAWTVANEPTVVAATLRGYGPAIAHYAPGPLFEAS